MGFKCFVPSCTSGYKSNLSKVSIFKAPKDVSRFNAWKRAIPRADKELQSNSCVCALHFPCDMIVTTFDVGKINGEDQKIDRGRAALRHDAIPCIFPNLPSYLSKVPVKRSYPRKRNLINRPLPERTSTSKIDDCSETLNYDIPSGNAKNILADMKCNYIQDTSMTSVIPCKDANFPEFDKNVKDNQFTSSLRHRISKFGIPTIFPIGTDTNGSPDATKINEPIISFSRHYNSSHFSSTLNEQTSSLCGSNPEESLKRLNSLIKELEDTNAALNQGINVAEVDFGTYGHIKKEVDETAILTFEDITAEDRATNLDCESGKNNMNPHIITYEEITSEDKTDLNETLISKQSELLTNSFEEKYSSLDIDKEIKLEIIKDEDEFNSVQEQIYTFSGITSGDDCERKYEFKKINSFLKREMEDDVKLEMGLIDNSEKFEKIKDEILMWDEVNAGDDINLSDNLDIKEDKCEDMSEDNIKTEEVYGDEETISSTFPFKSDATCKDIPFLTHQISKQNNLLTSENNYGRSVSRKENQIAKIGSYQQSATSEISYNKKVWPTTQAATNKEAKSFERTRSDRVSLYHSSANENKNNLVNKVCKKDSDKGNAGITANSSRSSNDPYKKCLAIPVDKNIVFIKLKPFKRKKRMLV